MREHWLLDPKITFLNHGSFGACPKPVLAVQQGFREQLEREPVRFFVRELPGLLDRAREALAGFLGCVTASLAFVPNATSGINAVLRSLRFRPGDELVTTDHEYNASRNVLEYAAAQAGAGVVIAKIPFPLRSAGEALDAILAVVTPRTRIVLADHVTSATGLVLPIGRLATALRSRGVDLLVDGAHAPGMLPLDLAKLGADFYTGNCHKWICAPKGAAFLYVAPHRLNEIRPHVISHGANTPPGAKSRFHLEFDWPGTQDPTAFLAVPAALEFMASLLPGGFPALMAANRSMALEARDLLLHAVGGAAAAPDDMIGSLAAIELPDAADAAPLTAFETDPLQDRLFLEHQIEVPIVPWPAPGKRLIRVSAQIYNTRKDYERLADALRHLIPELRSRSPSDRSLPPGAMT